MSLMDLLIDRSVPFDFDNLKLTLKSKIYFLNIFSLPLQAKV